MICYTGTTYQTVRTYFHTILTSDEVRGRNNDLTLSKRLGSFFSPKIKRKLKL